MTLLDAAPFDARRHRRRRSLGIILAVIVVLAVATLLYWPRYIAGHTVNRFFDELVKKNYQEAYYIWQPNPKLYPMDVFMKDWGPGSRWGIIKTFRIDELGPPSGGHSSGLVALVEINGIQSDEARIWIQDRTHELGFYMF